MGVPGFFAWLLRNNVHNNIIINTLNNIDCLYFDANCLFHPKCFDILKLYSNITDVDKLENLMMDRIIKMTQLIRFWPPSSFIQGAKVVYYCTNLKKIDKGKGKNCVGCKCLNNFTRKLKN